MFLSFLRLSDLSHDFGSWWSFLKQKKKPKIERDGFVSVVSTIIQMVTYSSNKKNGKIYWYNYLWTFTCLVAIGLFTFVESYSLTYLSVYIIPLMLNAMELNNSVDFYYAVKYSLYATVGVFLLRAILSAITHGTKSRMVRDLREHMHMLDARRTKQRLNNDELNEDVATQLSNDPFERLVGHAPGILKVALSFSVNLTMAIIHLRAKVILYLVLAGILGSFYCQKASRWLVSARKAHFDADNMMNNHSFKRDIQTIGHLNSYESANTLMSGLIHKAQKFTFIKNFCDSLLDNITMLCKHVYVVFLYWLFAGELFSGQRTLSQVILDLPFGIALANHAADGIGLFMMARNMASDIYGLKSSWNELTPEYKISQKPLRPKGIHTAYLAVVLVVIYSFFRPLFFMAGVLTLCITLCGYVMPTSSFGMCVNYILYGVEGILGMSQSVFGRMFGKRAQPMQYEDITAKPFELKLKSNEEITHKYQVIFDKSYNINFNLKRGKIHFISGKNGAGKTYCFAHITPDHFSADSLKGLYDYRRSLVLNGQVQVPNYHQIGGQRVSHAYAFSATFGLSVNEFKEAITEWYKNMNLDELMDYGTLMSGLNGPKSRNVFSLGQQKVILFIAAVHKVFKNKYQYLCIDEALYGVPNHITNDLYQRLVEMHKESDHEPTIAIIHHDYDTRVIKDNQVISETYQENGSSRIFS